MVRGVIATGRSLSDFDEKSGHPRVVKRPQASEWLALLVWLALASLYRLATSIVTVVAGRARFSVENQLNNGLAAAIGMWANGDVCDR